MCHNLNTKHLQCYQVTEELEELREGGKGVKRGYKAGIETYKVFTGNVKTCTERVLRMFRKDAEEVHGRVQSGCRGDIGGT